MRKCFWLGLVIWLGFFCFSLPTGAVSENLITNGGFETGDTSGWRFGNVNRVIYSANTFPGAHSGNFWLDLSNCSSCSSDFGDEKTLVWDIEENLVPGQRFSTWTYFRSPQNGVVEMVVWAIGGEQEVFSTGNKKGNNQWQKLELNFEIQKSGHSRLRLQIYLKNTQDGIQYQFDDFHLINKPWIIGHKYLYHHVRQGTHWSGTYSYSNYEGWEECYVCGGSPYSSTPRTANPEKIVGPEPWRREFGNGDGKTYPYLGIYDDTNLEMMKWLVQTQKNAGIEGWMIAFWSDALPQSPPNPPDNWYYGGWKFLVTDLIPYFRQVNFKFFVADEMVYNWDNTQPPDTERMKNHALAVLKTFQNEPSYLRINGKMVYYLPIIDPYLRLNRLAELNQALTRVEQELGEEVFWLGYTGNWNYAPWKNTKIKAFFDGYGLTGAIFDDTDDQGKIRFYSQVANNLWASGAKGLVMSVMPSFTSQYFNGDTSRIYRRNQGQRFLKSIAVFQGIKPRPIMAFVTQAEWQEGKTIEPAVVWDDDSSLDPYKYLKILATNLAKIQFTPPPLPPAIKVDPLRAGEVYGRNAEIFKAEIPSAMATGKNYQIKVWLKNTGGAVWTRQTLTQNSRGWYRLLVDFVNQQKKVDLNFNEVITTNQTKEFIVSLQAPSTEGSYRLKTQMIQEGFTPFGGTWEQEIKIVNLKSLLLDWLKSTFREINGDSRINAIDWATLVQ